MHELFLSAFVGDDDTSRSIRILQGYCAMKPEPVLRRRLLWEGPVARKLSGFDPNFLKSQQQQPKFNLWRTLHEQLTRQSYIMQLVFDVDRDEFGQSKSNESVENSPKEAP
jgi:mediator of RNA polymerase II transcription subunit 18